MRSTILFVPGLRGHVADHWQTLLAAELPGSRTVPPPPAETLSRSARVAALDFALAEIEGPVILAAHSAGCMTVAHWARAHSRPIVGALLATPADMEAQLPPGYPSLADRDVSGWLPVPRDRLPFPSILAASANDPLASFERSAETAKGWGSDLLDVGAVGHLNPASGFGRWPRALELLEMLDGDRACAALRPVGVRSH